MPFNIHCQCNNVLILTFRISCSRCRTKRISLISVQIGRGRFDRIFPVFIHPCLSEWRGHGVSRRGTLVEVISVIQTVEEKIEKAGKISYRLGNDVRGRVIEFLCNVLFPWVHSEWSTYGVYFYSHVDGDVIGYQRLWGRCRSDRVQPVAARG